MKASMQLQLPLLLHLLCLLSLATAQCLHEGRVLQRGELLPYPQDNCFNRVCRCESWDRCRLEVERKVVLVKVKETQRRKRDTGTSSSQVDSKVKMLQCRCIEDLEGSHEMNFFCAAKQQPGRSVEAKLIGCLDANDTLRLPGDRVTIRTSRQEVMECDCNASGHYVNCIGANELRSGCRDSEGRPVALGAVYNRTVSLATNRTVRLQCTCTDSEQETACRLLGGD